MPFQKFDLPASILKNIRALGYSAPTPIQDQAIPLIRAGGDVVGVAQTGTGKTAAFLLPIIQKLLDTAAGDSRASSILAARRLQLDPSRVESCFRGLAAGTPLRSALVIGGVPESPQERALRAGVDLVVATPGRLLSLLRGRCSLSHLHTLIIDEADQMFDLGFLPTIKRIVAMLPAKRQTMLFSATMPPDVARLSASVLHNPTNVTVGTQGTPTETVTQVVLPVPSYRKTALLEHLLEQMERPSVLIFTRTRHGARKLARTLNDGGHNVAELHADRTAAQRTRALQGFRARIHPILVATNIAARGLDVRHITHVINFDVPAAPEEYVHRIGRTGRAGDAGDSMVFMSPDESPILARVERQLKVRLPPPVLPDFDLAAPPPPRYQARRGGQRSGKRSLASRSALRAAARRAGKPSRPKGGDRSASERRFTGRDQQPCTENPGSTSPPLSVSPLDRMICSWPGRQTATLRVLRDDGARPRAPLARAILLDLAKALQEDVAGRQHLDYEIRDGLRIPRSRRLGHPLAAPVGDVRPAHGVGLPTQQDAAVVGGDVAQFVLPDVDVEPEGDFIAAEAVIGARRRHGDDDSVHEFLLRPILGWRQQCELLRRE